MRRVSGVQAAREHFGRVRGASSAGGSARFNFTRRDGSSATLSVEQIAAEIVAWVRSGGDEALRAIARNVEGAAPRTFEVDRSDILIAPDMIDRRARRALEMAAGRVEDFQRRAMPRPWSHESGQMGEVFTPVSRAGVYVPGGTAPLASTVIMTVTPAKVAGVPEVIMCTPARGDELPHPAVLASAAIAGVDRVFKIGGAQAVAAMAYGTESVPKVDIVCGPGSAITTAAKKLVYGDVGIDGLYGPTETAVVVDENSDATLAAADLLAQAEHDVMAMPILIAVGPAIAGRVEEALELQLVRMERRKIAEAAVRTNGVTVVVDSMDEAIEVANIVGPEHLCLAVADARKYLPSIKSAGGIFLGEMSAEVMADYMAGPSHVMPTGGTARFASALSVRHFLRATPYLDLDEKAFVGLAREAATLAELEGLGGHAEAAEARLRRMDTR